MSYHHAGQGRGDIGGANDRSRGTSGSGPAVPPFGNNMVPGATSGMSNVSSNSTVSGSGGNLGATFGSSRGLQSQIWGAGSSANADTGEPLAHY